MTLNKLTALLTGMFVTQTVFFAIVLHRNEQVREEVERLRSEIKLAA